MFATNPNAFTFTAAGLPKAYPDQIMGAGSVLLADFNHSLGLLTGVPGNGGLITNVAWQTAAAILGGSPTQAQLASFVESNQTVGSSVSYPLIERTPKLGLHAIRSQASDVNGAYYRPRASALIEAYMQTHRSDKAWYMSYWDCQTRADTTTGSPFPGGSAILVGNTSNYLAYSSTGTSASPNNSGTGVGFGGGLIGRASGALNTGAGFYYQGLKGYSGVYSGSPSVLPYLFGNTGGAFNGFRIGSSGILYRFYIEDLTTSAAAGGYANNGAITEAQRYIEVQARDYAMYQAAINTTGTFSANDSAGTQYNFTATGKLAGDTFTAPSGYP